MACFATEYLTRLLTRKREWRKFAVEQLQQLVECRRKLTDLRREMAFMKHLCLSADVTFADDEATSDDEKTVDLWSVCEQNQPDGNYQGKSDR